MSSKIEDISLLRVVKQPRKSGGPRTVHIYRCKQEGCANEISIRKGDIKKDSHSGMCANHSHRLPPFLSIYNGLKKRTKYGQVLLTFEEFLEFTKIIFCHYCKDIIEWNEYGTVDGVFGSRACRLDRIDNARSYSKENCVVACPGCNKLRGDKFSYEEFLQLSPVLEAIRIRRNEKPGTFLSEGVAHKKKITQKKDKRTRNDFFLKVEDSDICYLNNEQTINDFL